MTDDGDRALLAWSPVPAPSRRVLSGTSVRLEPLDPARHAAALFSASHDPADAMLWEYLPVGPFADENSFGHWLNGVATTDDPLFFAIVDQHTGEPAGMASYMRIEPAHGVIEIGFIWFGPELQRTRGATEAIYLLAHHAFELGNRRLEWKCDAANERSCQAAERFGFTFEGIFRQHRVVKGRNRDTAWYAILDREWSERGGIQQAFEAWLSPDNFDGDGRQRKRLTALRDRANADCS